MIREQLTVREINGESHNYYAYFADFRVILPDGVREYKNVDLAPYGNRLPVFAALDLAD